METDNLNKEWREEPLERWGYAGKPTRDEIKMMLSQKHSLIEIVLMLLFVFALAYAVFDIISARFDVAGQRGEYCYERDGNGVSVDGQNNESWGNENSLEEKSRMLLHENDVLPEKVKVVGDKQKQEGKKEIIGKWCDRQLGPPENYFTIYKYDGKMYLKAYITTVECIEYKIKGQEYKFRDDKHGFFVLEPGTSVYIGKGYEGSYDDTYRSDMILWVQKDNTCRVYMNDYDRRVYDLLCIAEACQD